MMRRLSKRTTQRGFTLIEIISVLIILGILAAVAVPKYLDLTEDAELRAVAGVKSELQARANSYFAQYLLDNTITTNNQNEAAWAAEIVGPDYSMAGGTLEITITVNQSGNDYKLAINKLGVNATDSTGGPAEFGAITP